MAWPPGPLGAPIYGRTERSHDRTIGLGASDFGHDGTHPDAQGATKVVNLLMGFYLTSPYTPWFRP